MAACHDAIATVVQVPGVQNHTNRFYSVHPRRNDRFLRPSAALETLYPDIDFADFAFTRHLLLALQQTCPDRFNLVRSELQDHWCLRMHRLLEMVEGPLLLLWLADHAPPLQTAEQDVMSDDPLFVTRAMFEGLAEEVSDNVIVVAPAREDRQADGWPKGLCCPGMSYHPVERLAAEAMLGDGAQELAAARIAEALTELIPARL